MIAGKLTNPKTSNKNHLLFSLYWFRSMGGGPRTFPGGLNKWQWKRLHEKKAREKEKRLLDQEKQIYQARIRSRIRASVLTRPGLGDNMGHTQQPVSPEDHVKALADRFVKAGAEDLWNDDDGPVCSSGLNPNPRLPIDPPVDLRKVLKEGGVGILEQKRGFLGARGCLGGGFGEKLEGYNGNLQQKRGFSGSRGCLGDGFGGKLEGYICNLQHKRGFLGSRGYLGDGFGEKLEGYNGNLQHKRGFSGSRGCLGDGFGGKLEGYICNLQHKRGFLGSRGYLGDGFGEKLEGYNGNLQHKRGFSGSRGCLGDGFGGKLEGYNGNLQHKRGFLGARGCLGDGFGGKLEGYNGNLQHKRGFLVARRFLGDGYGGEFEGYYGNLQQKKGFLVARRFLSDGYGGKIEGYNRNLVSLSGFHGILMERRGYSTTVRGNFKKKYYNKRYGSSSSDDDEEGGDHVVVRENTKWPRFSLEGEGNEGEEEGEREVKKGLKGFMGRATLGKYDVKRTNRRVMNNLEKYVEEDEEGDLNKSIEVIRQEVNERKMGEKDNSFDKGSEDDDEFFGTRKRFEDFGISPLTVKALTSAGYVLTTRVQEAALPTCLEGKDALVKAGSGTGKTAAFLLPAIETVVKGMSSDRVHHVPPIYALILCPTRELATQIAAETRVMLKHHVGLGVQMLAGGTRFKDDLKRLESDPCQILVATPGRLLDHIETKSGLSVRLMGLKILVLDEADRLLDLGFRKDVEKIVDCLPRQRQSLLFSATIPKEVRRVSLLVLKREHVLINAKDAGCPETSSKVKQSYITAPHDEHFKVVYQLLKEHISVTPDYKVIVFCTTGMVTSLMYHLFRDMKLNVREFHTRKPQLYRSRIADEFKQSKRLILISSDVSSRGVNYPDVTLVIQVGIPTSREQYMHRLGRTGREGKDGEGVLLLAPWEEYFLDDIKDMPIEKSTAPHINPNMKLKIDESMTKIDSSIREAAYHGWLGYYNSIYEIGRDKIALVQWANQFGNSIGLQTPPALFRKTVVKMGLKGIPGIRVRK